MNKKRVIIYFVLVIIFIIGNFYIRPIKGNKLITKEYKNSDSYINDLYYSNEMFKNTLDADEKEIYNALVEGSKENKTTIKTECRGDCSTDFHLAYEALYLDHPELLGFVGVDYCKYEDEYLMCKNISGISKLRVSLATTRILREIDVIKRDTKNMNEKDKIIYVYNYVASHNYDHIFMIAKSNQSAYSFFTGGKSVCAGFAKASQIILQNVGIDSMLVVNDNHMWNFVKYNKKWYVFDATVGASYRNKKHSNYYEGLGRTTVDETYGFFKEYYPKVEEEKLKDVFDLQ